MGVYFLTATRSAAIGTNQTTFLIDERLLTTVRTGLSLGNRTVGQVFLQCTLNTVLPGIDGLIVQFHALNQLDHLVDRHAVAQHAADELGVVPVLGVELL